MNVQSHSENFNLPVVAGIEITTDAHGRFNLNALHRASGGEKHKSPNKWLENQQTKELVEELLAQTPNSGSGVLNVVRGGNAPGTFAAEELAVSYAGWISPAFQLEVNRTFIACRKGETPTAAPMANDKLSREVRLQMREFGKFGKLMGLEGNQLALSVSKGVEKVTGVNPMSVMGVTHIPTRRGDQDVNVSDLGACIGVSGQAMNLKLISAGLQTSYRNKKGKLCYELTEAGKEAGGRWFDTQKVQGGRPVMQILWPLNVADLFREGGAA